MPKPLLLLVFISLSLPLSGQECDWITSSDTAGYKVTNLLAVDDSSNVIIVGWTRAPLRVGTHHFTNTGNTVNGGTPMNYFMVKYDDMGDVLAGWQPSFTYGLCYIRSIETDKSNNVYLIAEYYGPISLGNGLSLSNFNSVRTALIKFDANLKPIWVTEFGAKYSGLIGFSSDLAIDSMQNVMVAFRYKGTYLFAGGTDSISSTNPNDADIGLVKYDRNGNFQWARNYGSIMSNITSGEVMEMDCDAAGNSFLYFNSQSNFVFGQDTLNGIHPVILKVSPAGVPIRGISIKGTASAMVPQNPYGRSLSVGENGCLAIAGFFTGTAYFDTIKVVATVRNTNTFLAYFDNNLQARWVSTDRPQTYTGACHIASVTIKNNFVFITGSNYGETMFGSFLLGVPNEGGLIIVKADTLGNILWAFRKGHTNSGGHAGAADREGNYYITGSFYDSVHVFNRTAKSSYSGEIQFFVARISDYRIIRGYVYPGPYCAGDSISIPYVKYGNYDPANYFFAELSDEEGNFNGNHRELGRLKSDTDGVIKGQLPLFEVASSGAYRIRVRATHPQVQSFYKKDTLRLLVYSRDSADAGPDLTICTGDTIQLRTFGGTKWQWSPPGLQSDSSSRKIKVSPTGSTQYRIIISDSSGCGMVDTDYVSVFVRPPLSVQPRGDTTICKGQQVKLYAAASGGDSLNYTIAWYDKTGDTTAILVSPDTTTTYMVVLNDGCTVLSDTGYVTITLRPALAVVPRTDTTICKGQQLNLFASANGGDSSAHVFTWNNGAGTGKSIFISPDSSTIYRVILSDNCMPEKDSAFVTIRVRPALNITVRTDTTICTGQQVDLFAFAAGGDSLNYTIDWDHGTGTGHRFTISPDTTTIYRAILSDNCTSDPDSAFVKIGVRPPVKVTLNADSSICKGQSMLLTTHTSGGDSTYNYLWENGDTTMNRLVEPGLTTTYKLTVTDNCSVKTDSGSVTVTVRPELKVTPRSDTTICRGQSVVLYAAAEGGDSTAFTFQWDQNIGAANHVNVSPLQTTIYRVILSDHCSTDPDSAEVTITVRQALEVLVTGDTGICAGQPVTLFATGSGGDPSNYKFSWDHGLGDTDFVAVSPATTTIYRVILSDNCTTEPDTAFIKITVEQLPLPDFAPSVTIGCEPLEIDFALLSIPAKTTLSFWSFGDGTSSTLPAPRHKYSKSGLYTVKLKLRSAAGCTDSIEKTGLIRVNPVPKVIFRAVPEVTKLSSPQVVFINTSPISVSYEWSFGDGTGFTVNNRDAVTHIFPDTGDYIVSMKATNSFGCFAEKADTVRVNEDYRFHIPNSFTPNGDGLNDEFSPSALFTRSYDFSIYNRWGERIYQSSEGKAWNGKNASGDILQEGAYIYLFNILDGDGNRHHERGTVTLLK
jgi:gliding motility-associated-like protein